MPQFVNTFGSSLCRRGRRTKETRMSHTNTRTVMPESATGVIFVYSCPQQLSSSVQWAIARELGVIVKLSWQPQPLASDSLCAVARWCGPAGSGATMASVLAGWQDCRFEITEHTRADEPAYRWLHTPSRGITHQRTDEVGNLMLTEHAIRHAVSASSGSHDLLVAALDRYLGTEWDEELEPYRQSLVLRDSMFVEQARNAG